MSSHPEIMPDFLTIEIVKSPSYSDPFPCYFYPLEKEKIRKSEHQTQGFAGGLHTASMEAFAGYERVVGASRKSGSEYILPFLNGTTASPYGKENISNKIVL